jgi:hypothetical protein
MRRPVWLLLGALVAAAGLFALCHNLAFRLEHHRAEQADDGLEWLRREFQLTDAELNRIRPLHEGYQARCGEMCARIAARQQELAGLLRPSGAVTPEVEAKVREIALLRAECQTRMLHHFQEVAGAMPPGQGARYLAEMTRLTLHGHEAIESEMAHRHEPAGHR